MEEWNWKDIAVWVVSTDGSCEGGGGRGGIRMILLCGYVSGWKLGVWGMEGWNFNDIAVWVCQLMEARRVVEEKVEFEWYWVWVYQLMEARRVVEEEVEFEWYCCVGISADGS
jgi:hypothetical protein